MRAAILKEVYNQMKQNKDTYFLTGDLGFHSLEEIEREFRERFINAGVAEQNMIGIAAGLALSGKKVFVYSIIPFLLMRCFEQIRDDICFHDLNITLLGIGAGLAYGVLGGTHFALEDVAILRSLPNIGIFSPADQLEAGLGLKYLQKYQHPVYIRIGGREEPDVYEKPYNFEFGKGVVLREGKDAVIFSSGPIVSEVLKTATILTEKNKIKTAVIVIHTIKPIDKDLIIGKAKNAKKIFVVEEHCKVGGLGSAVSEILSEFCPGVKVVRIGTDTNVISQVGLRSYLRKQLGLDFQGIHSTIFGQLK